MVSMFNLKNAMVISGLVFIFSLMQIESFSDQGWELRTQLPTKRVAFATAVVGNKIYLIGGTLFKNLKRDKAVLGPFGISTVEVYDTQTNTWQRVADMPTPRHDAKAAVVNGTIYVFGGQHNREAAEANALHLNRKYPLNVEAYNPRTNMWLQKQEMPVSRVAFDLGVVDGKVYVIGGEIRHGGGGINRVDVYNPSTDRWVKGPEMPTPRSVLKVAVVGNRLYAIGGRGWPPVNFGPFLTVIEEYDSTSGQWRKQSDMLDTRNGFATVVIRDSIYLIEGRLLRGRGFAPEYLASVNVYTPEEDVWGDIPAMPIPFTPAGVAAAVNGRLYVFGGLGDVGKGWELFPGVVVYDTGFRAVEATGKLPTRWGHLKAPHPIQP